MSRISHHQWGVLNGKEIHLFRIENSRGAYIELSNYGAALVAVHVPDRDGILGNVVLGFEQLKGYVEDSCYIGATIGRFANRISGAKFVLDGSTYTLGDNDNGHNNHSGSAGFNARIFDFSIADDTLSFSLFSKDGDGGFPGNLKLKVSYRWTDDNELLIDYWAVSDQKTIANFTNHAYFNLSVAKEKIFDHGLTVSSNLVVAAGSDYIPTGSIVAAKGFVFNNHKIRENMSFSADKPIGINICYVLAKDAEHTLSLACTLTEENSGRVMDVFTSYPGLLLYTGDFLNSSLPGHGQKKYTPFDGLCLECQYFPDTPNQPGFPSAILDVGDTYQHSIIFKFSIKHDL